MAESSESPESDGGADDAEPEPSLEALPGRPAADRPSGQPPARKRQRVRLSCLECRRRKLSCDRGFPCERCIRSGTPACCSYEARNGQLVKASSGLPSSLAQLDCRRPELAARQDDDRIRRLELEVCRLKNQLLQPAAAVASSSASPTGRKHEALAGAGPGNGLDPRPEVQECFEAAQASVDKEELRFFRVKGFRTRYFGPRNASMAFVELTGLCPFMRETADQWLRPVAAHDRKDRKRRARERDLFFEQPDADLEALLPAKEDADALVEVYLDQFEQIHRIVHIPTFRRQYDSFWEPTGKPRQAAFTALVLAILAVASCVYNQGALRFIGIMSSARHWAEKWITACDSWLSRQSQKHRRLIHFQLACLLYLGRRVNTIKKKRFWTSSGALVQDGISVGLHREPGLMAGIISPFNQEIRRRIWATIQEFDMQASFDHGLPTLISQLHYDTNPPHNIDDDEFDEDSTALPLSKAPDHYTFSSFQNLARQSLGLRLELSRFLTGPPSEVDYDRVIGYTNDLTHEIDALPSWDMDDGQDDGAKKKPLIAYTLLHIQLRQYIIPLHQPYLKLRKQNSKYQYSEIIFYNAARDIVLLHDKLYEQGMRALNFLREDVLTTAINLCSVTMLQPRGSTNMIVINAHHTLKLMEKCIAMKEDRLLRCGNNEPWGYSILCAALGLLEAHLGTKTAEEARSTAAERFVNLHYRLLANQEGTLASGLGLEASSAGTAISFGPNAKQHSPGASSPSGGTKPMTPFAFQPAISMVSSESGPVPSLWTVGGGGGDQSQTLNLDSGFELLGLNLNELWGETWDLGQ